MAQFRLEIAGFVASVTSLFESTSHYFAPYLTEKHPDFAISVTEEDLRFEQQDADEEARTDGFRRRCFPDPFLERAAIQRKFAEFLLDHGIILLHGSTVAVDGMGYLFTARSGTGKSTHTRLWREVFGSRAVMVNDDKPFAHITESEVLVYGSPWSGKHGLDNNICVPLKGICLLERGAKNRVRGAEPEELTELLKGFRPQTQQQDAQYRKLLKELVLSVPLWHMDCTKETAAAQTAYETMSV